jgi:chromate transporter
MNLIVLYLILAKSTLTSFSGLGSLPVIRHDLVEHRKVLTDRQVNAAVAAGQSTPGPIGNYVVAIGYFAAGWPGAVAGLLAVMTPAFLIIPLMRYLGRRAELPRVKGAIDAVMLAAAGLVLHATIPLARDAITGWIPAGIAVGAFVMLVVTKRDTVWVIAGSALVSLALSYV